MTTDVQKKWLLLIHQIPPKPNALRVKIWRRLLQVGAVAIKQSVYAMPFSDQSREDLSWTLKEIVDGGGDGSISEACFIEGLTDEQIVAMFQNARRSDYEKLIQETNLLLADWSSGKNDPHDPALKGPAQVSRLRRRLNDIAAIDFFRVPERATAEILLEELVKRSSAPPSATTAVEERSVNLEGKTWVTRKNLFVDRIACGWLIRNFVDKNAVFKFVSSPKYTSKPGEIRFDMFGGEYTHEGDCCTFEVMLQRLQLKNRALVPMAEVVHDIDLKDDKYGRPETGGFNALLTGLVASQAADDQRLAEGMRLFDNLYAFYKGSKGG
ncbi:MAG: chromate resistance protein ChrB domain-containing protein [Thermodesulfobacteriota bacterium]